MSEYEDYDRASEAYSRIRVPVGLEILLGIYSTHLRDLSSRRLVDIGCGAATYALPLSYWFGEVQALDKSPGQIEQASLKCADRSNVKFQVADARELPLESDAADACLLSLMLHHVPSEPDSWTGHRQVFQECARILRPGGVMVLGICSQQQVFDGAWYCRLMPRAAEVLASRHPRPEVLTSLAQDAGFFSSGQFVPVDRVLQGPGYFDGRGILRQDWRDADSIFSLLSESELADLVQRVRQMDDAGNLDDFVRRHDDVRKNIGQVTFMAFVRRQT